MNKDIEDALRAMHNQLRQIEDELKTLATQYPLDAEEDDCIGNVHTLVGNAIREIQRYVP